ncbi:MAG: C10 family peptidase [Prevotella sp.]|nr:C10 family peptidase [Prevotella sp.]
MKTFLLVLSLLTCLPIFSANRDSVAYDMARRSVGARKCVVVKKTAAYSIYQNVEGEGFSIVAHDNNGNVRLLGYSTGSSWKEDEMPDALKDWLKGIETFRLNATVSLQSDRIDVAPLLTSHWHQTSPYNDLAPVIEDGNVKTVAGCVAIAAAQVVYYWRKDNPEALLKDTPVYPYGKAPVTYSIPKGTPNNWELIQDSYDNTSTEESRAAVAQLVYAVGTGSYLDYGSSTGGQISQAKTAVYSQYRLLGTNAVKSEYTQEEWEQLLYSELLAKRPMTYSGNAGGSDGHAFVIDGYDAANNLFHINFGWGGSGDGYYTVDDVSGAGGYCGGQACVYNMRPKNRNIASSFKLASADMLAGNVDIQFTFVNNSTLPIEDLFVYDASQPADVVTPTPIASLETTIDNDGTVNTRTIKIPVADFEGNMQIKLTDRYSYTLATFTLDLATDVSPVGVDNKVNGIYSVNGTRKDRFSKGINILKRDGSAVKILR